MSHYITVQLQRRVREHFRDCCAYCQTAEHLTAMSFEFEHICPRAAGGKTIFENLCLACPYCNRHKGDRQNALDPDSSETVPLFHPQQQA
ncbi:MAG: HNH endonuclease [Elainellaceae cyanobacterium]